MAEIEKAAKSANRKPEDIVLVAACKTQPNEIIDAALAAGQKIFGENRVAEAYEHFEGRDLAGVELRMIGSLQSKKAEDAVAIFDVIESLDRPSLALALSSAMQKLGKTPKLLVQVNIGDEPQKSGISVPQLPKFLEDLQGEYGLQVSGLMCIPPARQPAGPYFALMRKLADRHHLQELSMGMSDDFKIAIQFGATHIRIGSALFGERTN
ncbi:MAG: YggS family pyridoxal phosphate-dependent enzyme [Pseudomonadota bacterium]